MKRVLTILAGLALALTGLFATAPAAQASHVYYCSLGQEVYAAVSMGAGGRVCGNPWLNYEGSGNFGYQVDVWDAQADGFCARLERNASWVNDGWVQLGKACGVGTIVKYLTQYNPPCGDGDDGLIHFRWIGVVGGPAYTIDPPDCT